VHPLFSGPGSLREPSERLAFWLTALCALPAALLIGYLLHESIGASQVALFIVIAMIYVTLARGRLLGSSVRIHEAQYPRVFEIVKRACAALEIPMPIVFVREDNNVPAVALGFGEPYALVLSSHWVETLADDELAFVIGRELGHIAAGHTRFHSLLSVNGNENPFIALIFGAWLRRCVLTCDKVGLLCCGSLDAAIRAMGVCAFHEFARKVDFAAFAQQQSEIEADTIFRWGVWLGSEPYATARIAALRRFIGTQAYANAEAWFLRERGAQPPPLAAPGALTVGPRDCAGWWRRFAAYAIDAIVVSAIITSFGGSVAPGAHRAANVVIAPGVVDVGGIEITGKSHAKAAAAPSPMPQAEATFGPFVLGDQGVGLNVGGRRVPLDPGAIADVVGRLGFAFWFPVYLAVLVILSGQTFGMLIAGLRVVTVDFRKPSILRTIARYTIVFFVWWLIVPFSLIWRRVLLHDRWTKTRVVMVERVVARAAAAS
jgi:uncharacterized RDD family membrane protein YckC